MRAAAALALSRLGSQAADGLVAALSSLTPEARLLAVEALGRCRATQAVAALAAIADEPHDEVLCVAAIDALAAIGDEPAAEALVARLPLPAPLGPAVALALARRDVARERVQRLVRERLEEAPQVALLAALALIGTDAGGHAVLRALADEDAEVRRVAATALGSVALAGTASTEALLAALGDEEAIVAAAAASALGQRGDPAAIPTLERRLLNFLSDGAWSAAIAAQEALAALGGASATALGPAFDAAQIEVRKTALRLAGPDAVEPVLRALAAPRWDERATAVRSAARQALTASPVDRARIVAALEALAATEADEAVLQALATARAARGAA